jgi:hypothetical protein
MRTAILVAALASCTGRSGTTPPPTGARACATQLQLEYCNDFDDPTQAVTPFGFAELLGGQAELVTIEADNRGLSLASEGAAFAQSPEIELADATRLTVEASLEPFETAEGEALVVGMILLDGGSPLGRQIWVRASGEHVLDIDALGQTVATTGRLEPGARTTVRLEASWNPGGTTLSLDVLAGAPGQLAPILEDLAISIAPPPRVACAIAVISGEPGLRRFVFDDVRLDLANHADGL